ncbi:MAG TPA: hypothetical protein VLF63_01880, partial [Patescibacteria group bacterium]|nr:hypothetical protein [Patescibacteria group bacterium]
MANSNKLPNDDQSGIKPTNIDEIKLQEGIDKNALDDKSPQKDQTVESDESSGLYNPGGESSDESTKDSELNTSDQDNGDFKYNNQGSSEKRNIRSFFWGTKRRKQLTVGGVIFSVLLGGGLFGLTNLSGAAQLVQLSQMLQKNFRPMQKTSIVRGNRLLRFASSKDLGETRLGVLDKQVFRSALSDLSDIGITFGTNSAGQLNKSTIEADKLVKSYPELKDMSPEQKQAWLADKFNISSDLIAIHSGNRFTVDATDFPIKSLSALTKNTLGLLGDGRIISSINNRV